ncbi:hypothetical protein BJ085DRAFT_27789 [Dimargaris cristalligena]|uniref:Myb-like domain-containing protein n=1 Tax=Dimargaris cristalligena TaxID=215637 RepID=A0A4P9ZWM8_9FUNG|nr:hypothetical protein BJ085DRAFT_27789 [Dimargaris cristalligena]|eukprot:RKP38076.1 hypothetical protein BJ085DRAFT_27789 [Dimargaris cristalligena]
MVKNRKRLAALKRRLEKAHPYHRKGQPSAHPSKKAAVSKTVRPSQAVSAITPQLSQPARSATKRPHLRNSPNGKDTLMAPENLYVASPVRRSSQSPGVVEGAGIWRVTGLPPVPNSQLPTTIIFSDSEDRPSFDHIPTTGHPISYSAANISTGSPGRPATTPIGLQRQLPLSLRPIPASALTSISTVGRATMVPFRNEDFDLLSTLATQCIQSMAIVLDEVFPITTGQSLTASNRQRVQLRWKQAPRSPAWTYVIRDFHTFFSFASLTFSITDTQFIPDSVVAHLKYPTQPEHRQFAQQAVLLGNVCLFMRSVFFGFIQLRPAVPRGDCSWGVTIDRESYQTFTRGPGAPSPGSLLPGRSLARFRAATLRFYDRVIVPAGRPVDAQLAHVVFAMCLWSVIMEELLPKDRGFDAGALEQLKVRCQAALARISEGPEGNRAPTFNCRDTIDHLILDFSARLTDAPLAKLLAEYDWVMISQTIYRFISGILDHVSVSSINHPEDRVPAENTPSPAAVAATGTAIESNPRLSSASPTKSPSAPEHIPNDPLRNTQPPLRTPPDPNPPSEPYSPVQGGGDPEVSDISDVETEINSPLPDADHQVFLALDARLIRQLSRWSEAQLRNATRTIEPLVPFRKYPASLQRNNSAPLTKTPFHLRSDEELARANTLVEVVPPPISPQLNGRDPGQSPQIERHVSEPTPQATTTTTTTSSSPASSSTAATDTVPHYEPQPAKVRRSVCFAPRAVLVEERLDPSPARKYPPLQLRGTPHLRALPGSRSYRNMSDVSIDVISTRPSSADPTSPTSLRPNPDWNSLSVPSSSRPGGGESWYPSTSNPEVSYPPVNLQQHENGIPCYPPTRRRGTHMEWTEGEVAALEEGIRRHGSHWTAIVDDFGGKGRISHVLAARKQPHLKDKARTIRNHRIRFGTRPRDSWSHE